MGGGARSFIFMVKDYIYMEGKKSVHFQHLVATNQASFISSLLFMTALLYLVDPHFSICNSLCLFSCTSLLSFIFSYKIK